MAEPSTKPYLIRAIHEWCTDHGFTPYLAVAVDQRTVVPPGYAKNGEIVLNVSVAATNALRLDNDVISFQARFNGRAHDIVVPISNVSAIYARENGHGMAFEVSKETDAPSAAAGSPAGGRPPQGKPKLALAPPPAAADSSPSPSAPDGLPAPSAAAPNAEKSRSLAVVGAPEAPRPPFLAPVPSARPDRVERPGGAPAADAPAVSSPAKTSSPTAPARAASQLDTPVEGTPQAKPARSRPGQATHASRLRATFPVAPSALPATGESDAAHDGEPKPKPKPRPKPGPALAEPEASGAAERPAGKTPAPRRRNAKSGVAGGPNPESSPVAGVQSPAPGSAVDAPPEPDGAGAAGPRRGRAKLTRVK